MREAFAYETHDYVMKTQVRESCHATWLLVRSPIRALLAASSLLILQLDNQFLQLVEKCYYLLNLRRTIAPHLLSDY